VARFIKHIKGFSSDELRKSVRNSYNSFAKDWDRTRQHAWYEFKFLEDKIKNGDSVLDLGCGNGRLLGFLNERKNIDYTGVDNSEELISIAKSNYPDGNFEVGNALSLPYADNSFDFVASFAVFHHIPGRKTREKFMSEISRVLKKDGEAFITVWNIYQPKYKKYMRANFFQKIYRTIIDAYNVSFGLHDAFIPFGNEKIPRYVHGFTPKEFERLSKPNFSLLEAIFSHRDKKVDNWKEAYNLCLYLRKK
jgi:ubiquinone/menaquinone biosynthesis C-methylase UbiE